MFNRHLPAARAMNDLLQNMILIARIESSSIRPVIYPHNAATLMAELASPHTHALTEKGLAFALDIAADMPLICVDRDYMGIILSQLFRNAQQHTDQGEIMLSATLAGERVQFELRDTGRGISEEDVPRLFRRFQRAGSQSGLASEERGAGLGLAIVKQLVEQIDGTI